MRITIRIKTGRGNSSVKKFASGEYEVSVTSHPQNNEANEEMLTTLGKHLKVAPTYLKIVQGHSSKKKTIQILKELETLP